MLLIIIKPIYIDFFFPLFYSFLKKKYINNYKKTNNLKNISISIRRF